MSTTLSWTEQQYRIGDAAMDVSRAGTGRPLVVLHHDIGTPDRLPFYDALASKFEVLIPHHPGFGRSPRVDWLRSTRDVAVLYQGLLAELGVKAPTLVVAGLRRLGCR